MADMRRRGPEPPVGPLGIQMRPGLANQTLRELGPLLAEEGIDVDNIDVPDLATLQQALDRAVERHNLARFTPVGRPREQANLTQRAVVAAIAENDTTRAGNLLDQVQPESADNTTATVASCIGIALGLLDDWFCRHSHDVPAGLAARVRLPPRSLDGQTRGHRHPGPGQQRARVPLAGHPAHPPRWPAGALRQRAGPVRHPRGLVASLYQAARRTHSRRPGLIRASSAQAKHDDNRAMTSRPLHADLARFRFKHRLTPHDPGPTLRSARHTRRVATMARFRPVQAGPKQAAQDTPSNLGVGEGVTSSAHRPDRCSTRSLRGGPCQRAASFVFTRL
jgi:hypothetical protein